MVSRHIATTLSPVSSIKRMLKNSHTRRGPVVQTFPPAAPIERLPTHVIREIGSQAALGDVLSLSLCSRRLRITLAPIFYATVELKTNKHCKDALVAFSKQPEITQHIRHLIVRPNNLEWTEVGEEVNEDNIASLLAAMADRLRGLEAFEWDGMEMPHDDLWSALKKSCRFLKRISTSIGEDALNPSSPLWDFSDLRLISLNVRCHSLEWLAEGLPKTEKLPRKFWAMLLERCPRLEELTIGGPAPSPRVFDIRHLMSGRWPRLQSVTLGDMVVIASSLGAEQANKDNAAFMAFLTAHPLLRSISLQHAAASVHFPSVFVLPPKSLPNVTSFGGPLKLVKTLPNRHRLRHLNLTSLHHTPSVFPPTFAVLRDLKDLDSLSIWLDLSCGTHVSGTSFSGRVSGESPEGQPYDDVHMLRSLVSSSPRLKHLKVACFTRPTFSMRQFSRLLQGAPDMESFVLTKVHKSNDESMTRSATRIITDNPNLRHFTIRTTQDSWFSPERGRVKQLGVYDVMSISTSNPTSDAFSAPNLPTPVATLFAHEWGQKTITRKPYSRHFVHHVLSKESPAPPSAFGKHHRSLSLSRVQSFVTNSESSHEPASPARSLPPTRWNSLSARSRRSSFSDIMGSITSKLATIATSASSASSGSASSQSASSQSATWAERDGLGRRGSSSSGSAFSHGRQQQSIEDEEYVLV